MAVAHLSFEAPPPRQSVPNVKVPETTTALLSEARKMPCLSFSLPAGLTCPGAVFTPESPCYYCYARNRGHYAKGVVKTAQQRRMDWAVRCMRTPEGRDEFITTMVATLTHVGNDYFRGHDSGDFFSVAYIECWTEIARRLPGIRFWFPTQSWSLPHLLRALVKMNALPNVTIRPSSKVVDEAPPTVAGLAAGSYVTRKDDPENCPASGQGGFCRDCRRCWDQPTRVTPYPIH